MKYVHNCELSVYCKPSDDCEQLKQCLERFKIDTKLPITEEYISIDEGHDITILRLRTEKQRHNTTLIKTLLDYLTENQKNKLCQENDRVDEKGAFYVRLDKESLLKGTAAIVEHGDCFHFRFLLAAYPKNRDNAIRVKDEMMRHG